MRDGLDGSLRAGRLLVAAALAAGCARPYTKQVDSVTRLDASRAVERRLTDIRVVERPTVVSPELTLEAREEVRAPEQRAGVYQTYTQEWGYERNSMHWKNGEPDTVGMFLNVLNFPAFTAFYFAAGTVALMLEPVSPCAARHTMAAARNVLLVFLSERTATVDCKSAVGGPKTGEWKDTGATASETRAFTGGSLALSVDGKRIRDYATDYGGRLRIDVAEDVMGLYEDVPRSISLAVGPPAGGLQSAVDITDASVLRALHRRHASRDLARQGDASLQGGDLPDAIRRYEEALAADASAPGVADKLRDLREQAEREGPARWARSLALSGIANVPAAQRDALAGGRIVWEKNSLSAEGFGLDPAAPAWTNVERVVAELSRLDQEKFAGAPRPRAPKLVQGAYEPGAVFNVRVAAEKKKLEEALAAYDAKLAAYPAWRRNAVLQTAVGIAFGSPRVLPGRDYDANAQVFAPQVGGDGSYAKDFRQTFVLSETVPYDRAPEFDQALQASSPRVVFERRGAKLALTSGVFRVGGKDHAALPAGASSGTASPLAKVDLSAMEKAAAEAPVSIQYAEDPQIAAKLAELDKLKKENAAKTELKALEAQIAELKRGERRSFSSDVDRPDFPARARRPDDFALVIGIESYQDSRLPKADYAQRDAEAVSATLERLGVPPDNIRRLTGDAATAGRIKGYLESWLPKNVKPGSRVYFYFSGHGAPDPTTHDAYLLSWDGDPGLLKTTAVSLSDVYASLGRLPAEQVLVAMDSCFSGASGRSVIKKGTRPLVNVRTDDALSPNLSVLAAAQNDETANSLEKEGHGMFTYYLLKGLSRSAGGAALGTSALCDRLKSDVREAAALENGRQNPVCRGADFRFW